MRLTGTNVHEDPGSFLPFIPNVPKMSRPAVSVRRDPLSRLQQQEVDARQLEQELQAWTTAPSRSRTSADETRAHRVRVNLCETLADMILTHPAFAAQHGIVGRLWISCFQSKLTALRQLLHQLRRHGKTERADQVEASLEHSLVEAITFYNYIIRHLQDQLLASPAVGSSAGSTAVTGIISNKSINNTSSKNHLPRQDSTPNALEASTLLTVDSSALVGIVSNIAQLELHVGDLYRYAKQLAKASQSYETSFRLAPGHGHAYNQLAVVGQLQQQQPSVSSSSVTNTNTASSPERYQTALAMYGYVRALLATHTRFDAADKNLRNLLATNRGYLHDWQQEQSGLQAPNRVPVSSRGFLLAFVEFHAQLLRRSDQSDGDDGQPQPPSVDTVWTDFGNLLQQNQIGDVLLCKLIAIQAYTEHTTATEQSPAWQKARKATLTMGTALVDRVMAGWQKPKSSSRILVAVLLVAEYLVTTSTVSHSAGSSLEDDEWSHFWKGFLAIANHLKSHMGILPESKSLSLSSCLDGTEEDWHAIKEYQLLRGFKPFAAFLPPCGEGGYLSLEEGAAWLRTEREKKIPSSRKPIERKNSQDTTASSTTSVRAADQGRLKALRFLQLAQQLADTNRANENDWSQRIVCNENGVFEWIEPDSDMQDNNEDDALLDEGTSSENAVGRVLDVTRKNRNPVEEDAKMVESPRDNITLVYQPAPDGGPPLLTPASLDVAYTMAGMPIVEPPVHVAATVTSPIHAPPPGIAPPPGLAGPAFRPPPGMVPPPGLGGGSGPSVMEGWWGFNGPPLSGTNHYSVAPSRGNVASTFSPYLFANALETTNPFAVDENQFAGRAIRDVDYDGSGLMDESSLLGPSLLNSIYMDSAGDDVTVGGVAHKRMNAYTKNPFAT